MTIEQRPPGRPSGNTPRLFHTRSDPASRVRAQPAASTFSTTSHTLTDAEINPASMRHIPDQVFVDSFVSMPPRCALIRPAATKASGNRAEPPAAHPGHPNKKINPQTGLAH